MSKQNWVLRSLGLVCILTVSAAAKAQTLISSLPLDGDLQDTVTGQQAVFSRGSVAWTRGGQEVQPNAPRYESLAVATGYVWDIQLRPHELVPIAIAGGELFATNDLNQVLASQDGDNFELRSVAPVSITSRTTAWTTPGQALLIAGVSHPDGVGRVYRSDDGGRTFAQVLVFPATTGFAQHWNFGNLGATVFVSEYDDVAQYNGNNARRIYRSEDDGRTFTLVLEPPPQRGWHDHKTLGDPWRNCIYQSIGDDDPGIWRSCDHGGTWQKIHNFYFPISGVARTEALYWGHDGIGGAPVERFEPATGRWTHPLRGWNGYISMTSRQGNVTGLCEHGAILYVPFTIQLNEVWASRDGTNWAFGRAFSLNDRGVYHLIGEFAGRVHGMYHQNVATHTAYFKFLPGQVVTLNGLRIEPPVVNLLDNDQSSSAEHGLDGWYHNNLTTLTWDNTRAYHGHASLCFSNPNIGTDMVLCGPALGYSLPVGTVVHGQVWLVGDESGIFVGLYDAAHGIVSKVLRVTACDEWVLMHPELVITEPVNNVRLIIYGDRVRPGVAHVWADACMLSATYPGQTWQLGGVPRTGEVLRHTIAFPPEWTDFVTFKPGFDSSQTYVGQRTLKAWVAGNGDYAALVFDAASSRFEVIEVVGGTPCVLATSPVVSFWRGYTCRLGVRSAADGCQLRVAVGTGSDAYSPADGPALALQPTELWIGSSPQGDDQAPGVYCLSRTFDAALSDAQFAAELEVLPQPPTGACCFPDGLCRVETGRDCATMGGTHRGDGTVCDPNPCGQPTGSCCFADGHCEARSVPDCTTAGGTYQGDGSLCEPNPCPQPTAACCFLDGHCEDLTPLACKVQGGGWSILGACATYQCPAARLGACCFGSGDCQVLTGQACATAGGTYQGDGTACNPNQCPQPLGACCFADGHCQDLTHPSCQSQGGAWNVGTDCATFQCPAPVGACCLSPTNCQELTTAACAAAGGTYQGNGTTCQTWTCGQIGDLNCDGDVNFDDISPFVLALSNPSEYQAQYPNCNILNGDCNGDGIVDFDDINPFVAILSH